LTEKSLDLLMKFIENSKVVLVLKILNQNISIVSDDEMTIPKNDNNFQSKTASAEITSNDFAAQIVNKVKIDFL
jgi:hypothetical protein